MLFSSLLFVFIFIPITLLIYYLVPKSLRNLILIIASLVFYAWGEPVYVLLMVFSTVINYLGGLLIHKLKDKKIQAKLVFILVLVINIGLLGFFKYYNFIVDNINSVFNLNITASELPLPIGISFYTFQTMSYIIDVYLHKVAVQKNILSFAAYVTMFPQLVAGPIVKYGDIEKQLKDRKHSLAKFGEGAGLFIIGLSKKVLLANSIGLLWSTIKNAPVGELSILSAWLGIIGFTFQIYFDFSGYSDMAIGLGKMFGFELMQNFNYPYISKSVTEFWRRWHISLGTWFREYVYIPLGGNRKGQLKQYRNIFVVWFLTGLWHGANWNFIYWGLYFGVLLMIEKKFLLKFIKTKPILGHVYTGIAIIVGWVIFEFENTTKGLQYIKTMFGFGGRPLVDNNAMYYLVSYAILFIILILASTPLFKKILKYITDKNSHVGNIFVCLVCILLFMIATAYLVNGTYNPFLYFKF